MKVDKDKSLIVRKFVLLASMQKKAEGNTRRSDRPQIKITKIPVGAHWESSMSQTDRAFKSVNDFAQSNRG